jgi:SAM-dependent methyltransferase
MHAMHDCGLYSVDAAGQRAADDPMVMAQINDAWLHGPSSVSGRTCAGYGRSATHGWLYNHGGPGLLAGMLKPPPVIDPGFYRGLYSDLSAMADGQLLDHWSRYGISEGRQGSAAALRGGLLGLIRSSDTVLEIGPFTNPAVVGPNVKYCDVLDREGLVSRAQAVGYPPDRAVPIDFVSPNGDLSVVNESFDIVVSCHCIEHQPDLIHHLSQVSGILNPGGVYLLVIPDKRYCFDHFIPESTVDKILSARGRNVHTTDSLIEHRAHITHNDASRHWLGDHGRPAFEDDPSLIDRAVAEFNAADGRYIDVHAWQFTPASFRALMMEPNIPMVPLCVYETPHGNQEFCALLGL